MNTEEQYEEARRRLDLLRGLRDDDAYRTYRDALEGVIRAKRVAIFSHTADTFDSLILLGNMQAEMQGIQQAFNHLDHLIEEAAQAVLTLQEELELETEGTMTDG